jgi:hypothetical protein
MDAIARDIEALGSAYPQLAAFRAAQHLDRDRLVIEYAFHTHTATHRGGWTAGVPNPDADGIWLHVDLHDADSKAQIHTQPDVPLLDALGEKLLMLLLEGMTVKPAAGELRAILAGRAAEANALDACGHPSESERPSAGATMVGIDDITARKPRSGRFVSEGWVQIVHHCAPCPPSAACKPCEEVVWLSAVRGAFKDPLARDQNLVLAVPDAHQFDMLGHYRVVFVACSVSSDPAAPLTAELRGFERIP